MSSCVIEELPSFDPKDFDKTFGDILLKHEGNAQEFLTTVFGFLKRKSDFFKGEFCCRCRSFGSRQQVHLTRSMKVPQACTTLVTMRASG
mmetsp:Transcript_10488/g.22511  ORF Transcript_10488/g.22511 Transcript_10488/m.22511 type:complete len:90 (+) Transcript_10488:83-352(+)